MADLWAAAGVLAFVAVGLNACGRSIHTDQVTSAASSSGSPHSSVSPDSPAQNVAAVGVIYVAGSEPTTMLTLLRDSGAQLQLHGDLAAELRRMSGARVEVRGTPATMGLGDGITVSEYTVLEIDGQRPRVGVLAGSGSSLWITGKDSLALADPEGQLSPLAGAKVWVLADTTTSPAAVQAYGVMRDPPPR